MVLAPILTKPSPATAMLLESNPPSLNSLLCLWALNGDQLGKLEWEVTAGLALWSSGTFVLKGRLWVHSGTPDTGAAPRELQRGWREMSSQ